MSAITDNTVRAAWQRIMIGLVVGPMALILAVTAAGTGNFPLGGFLVIAPIYVLGVVVLDLWSVFAKNYRSRPKFLIGCLAAALPTAAWLIWLGAAT